MRDNIKILKVLRKKNFSNEYNLIYDNITNVDIDQINNSSLKDAHKKILRWYKSIIKTGHNTLSSKVDDQIMDDIKSRITYGTLHDITGDVYRYNDYDNYYSNILIPSYSKIFVYDGKMFYKHIELKKEKPSNLSLIGRNITFTDYKNDVIKNIDCSNAEILNIGKETSNSKISNLVLNHGIKFF